MTHTLPVNPTTSFHWEVTPFTTWRVNSLPASLHRLLRFPRTLQTLEKVKAQSEQLTAAMTAEAERMTEDVQQAGEHQELRRALINARRQLHQGLPPKTRDLEVLQAQWDAERVQSLMHLVERFRAMDALRQALPDLLFEEYRDCQRQVKGLVSQHPDFAASLDCAVPEVAETLEAYLQAPPSQTLQEWRKFELTLTTYLTRAAFKTSPLGRLTYTALVDLQESHRGEHPEWRQVRSRVQLQGSLLRKLFLHVTAHAAFAGHQRYAFNPDVREESGVWKVYVRRVLSTESVQDTTIVMPAKPALQHLRNAMQDRPFWRLTELQALLGLENPAPLHGLREQGLLVPEIQYADDLRDPVSNLISFVDRSADPLKAPVLEQLHSVQKVLEAYPGAAAPERRFLRGGLVKALQNVFTLLEVQEPFSAQRLLYENSAAELQLSDGFRSLPEEDLRRTAELVSLFGSHQDRQLELEKAFVARYGPAGVCTDPEAFLLKGTAAQSGTSELEVIDGLLQDLQNQRLAFLSTLREAIQQSEGLDVEVKPEWIPASPLAAPLELCLQHTGIGTLVLNSVLYGQHNALSRVWPLLEGSSTFQRFLKSQQQREVTRAQLVVSSFNSMNQFPTLFEVALKSPGSAPACQTLREVRLTELVLRHDPTTHSLKLETPSGEAIEPVYVGSYTPLLMTTIDRGMVGLSQGTSAHFSLVEMLEALSPELQAEEERFYPRIVLGQVVLSRRTWVMGGAAHLRRQKNETDLAYWQRLLDFWQDSGLPRSFFAVPTTRGLRLQGSDHSPYKPQFFDLEGFWCLRSFEKWISEVPGQWWVQETLPDPTDAFVHHQQDRHVSEVCVRLHPHKEKRDA
ncbi:lantibiotic dehydratase [Deinococcus cellulosilyticus]|uniref:Uncharacterized protein n=1 Tax=Deinococcus cellulosilyticus (strain DSM 18568 / NBRC 106333 / KACC 11606 / 5516J-15) TaxID=1223518 RepID=A0A511N206_DEIC1|nr:lantibiotic dehydratase [Deinococcus cellulosilyticus]GEM46894.1 hypothetical protein DC3_25290 [Deinococcus cellulosilyticus NBRC 106333 = KACC 11606]